MKRAEKFGHFYFWENVAVHSKPLEWGTLFYFGNRRESLINQGGNYCAKITPALFSVFFVDFYWIQITRGGDYARKMKKIISGQSTSFLLWSLI